MTPNTRAADCRTRSSACAAAGKPTTSSNAASGVSASTASRTPSMWPDRTAGIPVTSAPTTASPPSRLVSPEPSPAVRAVAAATCVSSASASAALASAAPAAP